MWTPRRILLALVGLLAFAAGFFGYDHFLGALDGLPPLPDQYYPGDGSVHQPPEPPLPSSLTRKLERAFGQGCQEIGYPIKTELKGRRTLVATQEFQIIKENDPRDGHRAGWVRLVRLSLAVFSEKRGPDGIEEINTLYADKAYLKFDKPIRTISDFNESKIVAAEIQADPEAQFSDPRKGRIRAQNNRRTLDPNDDIEMVTPGPVYYEDQPKKGQPHIYTFATVYVTDHLNTGLPEPNRYEPRDPTVAGDGMRVYLTPDDKKKKDHPKKDQPKLPIPHKDPTPGVTGVDLIELDHAVTMKLWTDADASFVAPGGGDKDGKKAPKKAPPKKGKDAKPIEKRLLTIETNGPFRYDLNKELAHFEKPAVPRPGLIEQVVVNRQGRAVGFDTLTCEYLDVQFHRKQPVAPKKDGEAKDGEPKEEAPPPPPKKKEGEAGDGDLEIKSIKAWGETVVMTSDSENLHATCSELTHDAEGHVTALKGDANQPVQAVKDGNLIRGGEIYLFGDGKEINQAHVLGSGSVGMGDLDPKSGEFFKTATFSDRLLYTREPGEKGAPPIDVLTFVGKDGVRCAFRDTSGDSLQDLKADLIKVKLKAAESDEAKKKDPAKKAEPKRLEPKKDLAKKDPTKKDATGGAKPTRVEARGHVESTSPDLVIQQTNYLEVDIRDVTELIKPPEAEPKGKDGKPLPSKKGPAGPKGEMPAPRVVDPKGGPVARGPEQPKPLPAGVAKDGQPKGEEPEEKKPIVVTAQTIHAWANRDPQGRNELDHVLARGDAHAHQDPANKDDLGTDIAGKTIFMQAYKEGNRLLVTGVPGETPAAHQWGVVRFDKLTMFGFDISIDQRDNTSHIKGEGSMEIVSTSDMEGKKLDKPTTMHIYWKHKMDFLGAEKLIYYHGGVQGYQEGSRLKCEWMQVLLDRPVLLNQDLKAKQPAKKKPGDKKDDTPNIDTVMCFYAPKDEDVPKPRRDNPVVAIQEEKEGDKTVRFQSIQAPDLVTINTKLDPDPTAKDAPPRYRKDMQATSSETMPGTVRIWQPGQKDALADKPEGKKEPPKKDSKDPKAKAPPPKKKGELDEDQEMQLTVVQFGGKMIANDFRKRAKFYNNIRCVHLPADSPTIPVDLREGEIPKGAVYLEARDSLDVFSTEQMERNKKTGRMEPVSYQEMIAVGSVRVNKQGEFFGDADRVTYSELKGTMTFHGTERNPARVQKLRGQGIKPEPLDGKTIVYYVKTKTFEVTEGTRFNQ